MAESNSEEQKEKYRAKSMQQQYTDKSEGDGSGREDSLDDLPGMKKVSSTVDKGIRNTGTKKGLEFDILGLHSDSMDKKENWPKSSLSFPLGFNRNLSGQGIPKTPPMGKAAPLQPFF